jgi:hypothetical protein
MTINHQWVMLNDEREIQNFDQFVQDDSLITAHGDSAVLKDLLICEAFAQALRLSLSGLRNLYEGPDPACQSGTPGAVNVFTSRTIEPGSSAETNRSAGVEASAVPTWDDRRNFSNKHLQNNLLDVQRTCYPKYDYVKSLSVLSHN